MKQDNFVVNHSFVLRLPSVNYKTFNHGPHATLPQLPIEKVCFSQNQRKLEFSTLVWIIFSMITRIGSKSAENLVHNWGKADSVRVTGMPADSQKDRLVSERSPTWCYWAWGSRNTGKQSRMLRLLCHLSRGSGNETSNTLKHKYAALPHKLNLLKAVFSYRELL